MSEGGSDNTAVKIIAIIGGVVVVIVLSCGVLGYFIVKAGREMAGELKETMNKAMETAEAMAQDMQQSQMTANNFVRDLQTGNLDIAYESTTGEFKKRMTRKDLDELVKKHPSLKGGLITPPQIDHQAGIAGMEDGATPPMSPQALPSLYRYRYEASEKDGKGKLKLTVTVVKEDGQMKVDQFTVKKPGTGDEEKDEP
jgi:hypothetical protein